MKRSAKEWFVRIVILLLGLVIAHFGVTLFLPQLYCDKQPGGYIFPRIIPYPEVIR